MSLHTRRFFSNGERLSEIVFTLDEPRLKLTVLRKELIPIEPGIADVLRPLKPLRRYEIMTDRSRHPVLTAQVGDTVFYSPIRDWRTAGVGLVQYVGPVKELGEGTWFGIELIMVIRVIN